MKARWGKRGLSMIAHGAPGGWVEKQAIEEEEEEEKTIQELY
jgi:hypothetical protein